MSRRALRGTGRAPVVAPRLTPRADRVPRACRYTGWGLASGTQCAMSLAPASLWYLTLFIVPNSDAYLAQKYPSEFPAYLAATPRLIPGVYSPALAHALAWAGLLVSLYLEINCGTACGMGFGGTDE